MIIIIFIIFIIKKEDNEEIKKSIEKNFKKKINISCQIYLLWS